MPSVEDLYRNFAHLQETHRINQDAERIRRKAAADNPVPIPLLQIARVLAIRDDPAEAAERARVRDLHIPILARYLARQEG